MISSQLFLSFWISVMANYKATQLHSFWQCRSCRCTCVKRVTLSLQQLDTRLQWGDSQEKVGGDISAMTVTCHQREHMIHKKKFLSCIKILFHLKKIRYSQLGKTPNTYASVSISLSSTQWRSSSTSVFISSAPVADFTARDFHLYLPSTTTRKASEK